MGGCDAAALVARAAAAGVRLSLDGERVRLRAEAAPPASLVAELRVHKLAVAPQRGASAEPAPLEPLPLEPQPWAAADWRELFNERLAVAMVDGEQPEAEARRTAWQDTVTRWCLMHPGAARDQAATALRELATAPNVGG